MSDREYMLRCLELAARARGRTAPNPMVGAVVVRRGKIVGEGWHTQAGSSHAEVVALAEAGAQARGATLYVNLEPCSHFGRTPPCTEAILSAGVSRVVVGMSDPHPLVDGRGIARLQGAGLDVEVGLLKERCRSLNRAFLKSVQHGMPLVVLKAGMTMDGRIATCSGESTWITGERARWHAQGLRGELDAILVGSGTALADDPRLNCRLEGGRDPVPVVLDSRLRVPHGARMFHGGRRALAYTLAVGRQVELPGHPAHVVGVPSGPDGSLSLVHVFRDMVSRGLHSVLVEGGARVHRSFVLGGLADRVLLYMAPMVLAGGPAWMAGPGISSLYAAPRFRFSSLQELGSDVLLELEAMSPATSTSRESGSSCRGDP